MESFVSDLILKKVDEIVVTIQDSREYQDYQILKEKMNSNQHILKLIEEIKTKQKELVRKKYNHDDTKKLEEELYDLENELKIIPLYCDFLEKQIELNQVFVSIKDKIERFLDNIMN